ncbi:hypothetical protein [Gluconobacter wancherniae]|uniref:hypothetical protein n=1 Tax=Gluconobacter wancherniae TaxID=1307955 RepID=UPI001B8AA7CD|nr:hypothetical protein [Gluconobacter wancherniae]MBS1093835.1 hypothetical protein [Gluconobacter wancherniae]
MTGPRDLNVPLPHQICNLNGTLTALGQVFLRRLWERSGYAPGIDLSWIAQEADQAVIASAHAQSTANAALREAQDALDLAKQILMDAQSIRAQALKALELARDCAIIASTAQPTRDGSQSDESMVFAIMKP